jgi:hypothetical protein
MSWLYSQALVEEYLGENFSDGAQSALSNGNHIQQAYCSPDKMTVFLKLSRYGMTFKPLTESRGQELLTLYLAGFHAKTSAQQERVLDSMVSDQECGSTWRGWLARYDQDSSSWKTAQCSLIEDSEESLVIFPRWGMTRSGLLWEQPTLAQITKETEFGLSEKLPTPQSTDYRDKPTSKSWKAKGGVNFSLSNPEIQAKWLTPRVVEVDESPENFRRRMNSKRPNDRKHGYGSLTMQVKDSPLAVSGGKLNPTWVEWLMGWTLGWTDLKPLVMDKSHCVPQQHGNY